MNMTPRILLATTLLGASASAASAQTVYIDSGPPAYVVPPRVVVTPPVYAAPATIVERRVPEVAVVERPAPETTVVERRTVERRTFVRRTAPVYDYDAGW
jgi:hypothetical protein